MPSLKHIHSYIKFRVQKSDGQQLWKCADPRCTHFDTQTKITGKLTLCPGCHDVTFVLDGDMMRRTRPLCINCRDTKEAKAYREHLQLMSNIFEPEAEVK